MKLPMLSLIVIALFWTIPQSAAADGRVPVRNVFESMGASVKWNSTAQQIHIVRKGNQIQLTVGSRLAYKNGRKITLHRSIQINPNSNSSEISTLDVYRLAKSEDRERHYRVKAGDSLWSIAKRFQVSVGQLTEWNQLSSQTIVAGQHLHVSDPRYVVRSGDSLTTIAAKTESTVDAIKKANRLTSEVIQPGQTLWIPPRPSVKPPNMFKQSWFPLIDGTYDPYGNDYGDPRMFSTNGDGRSHTGIDIIANRWVPIFAVEDGRIVRKGWNTYGGWRLSIQSENGVAMYYAHMAGYAPGITKGGWVKKGQLIGYVGATGYGEEGTRGMFVPHLHLGMYDTTVSPWKALNPYWYLQWWEMNE